MVAFKNNLDRRIQSLKREEQDFKGKRKIYEDQHSNEILDYKKKIEELKVELNEIKKSNQEFRTDIIDSIDQDTRKNVRVTNRILDHKILPFLNLGHTVMVREAVPLILFHLREI